MNVVHVQPVEPTFFRGPPKAFNLRLAGTVSNLGMQENGSDGSADQRQLFVHVWRPVIGIKFRRNAVGSNSLLEDTLEVGCGIIVEKCTANDKPGVIIDDTDCIYAM